MNGTLKKLFNYLCIPSLHILKNQNSRSRQLQANLTFCGHEMFRN